MSLWVITKLMLATPSRLAGGRRRRASPETTHLGDTHRRRWSTAAVRAETNGTRRVRSLQQRRVASGAHDTAVAAVAPAAPAAAAVAAVAAVAATWRGARLVLDGAGSRPMNDLESSKALQGT